LVTPDEPMTLDDLARIDSIAATPLRRLHDHATRSLSSARVLASAAVGDECARALAQLRTDCAALEAAWRAADAGDGDASTSPDTADAIGGVSVSVRAIGVVALSDGRLAELCRGGARRRRSARADAVESAFAHNDVASLVRHARARAWSAIAAVDAVVSLR
jgi:hypothetical protein